MIIMIGQHIQKNEILNYISDYLYKSHKYNDFESLKKMLQRIFSCDMDTSHNNNNEIINLNNSYLDNQKKYNNQRHHLIVVISIGLFIKKVLRKKRNIIYL